MRENRLSGSMSGVWKRSTVVLLRHRQTKEPVKQIDSTYPHRATSRLHTPLGRFLRFLGGKTQFRHRWQGQME
jgi:hypothetical protein